MVREGHYGSAWFAHRADGTVSHVEVRGRDYKGSLAGGHKTLFLFGQAGEDRRRVAITEGPIDALSLAALEGSRRDTLYVATGGGMGPGTLAALQAMLAQLAAIPDALIESATDANTAGDRYAERHAELAADAGVRFERVRPPEGLDFNDVLKQRKRHVKPDRAWVSSAIRRPGVDARTGGRKPTGDVQGQAAKLALIVAYGLVARKRTIEQRDITSSERVCRIRIRRRKGAGRGATPCCARPCPAGAMAAARCGLREKIKRRAAQCESWYAHLASPWAAA